MGFRSILRRARRRITEANAVETRSDDARLHEEIAALRARVVELERILGTVPPPDYDGDNMIIRVRNLEFLGDPRFMSAYRRGMDSGHAIARPRGSRDDIHIEYRVYVCCWAAKYAARLPGDFVECGVNTGLVSLAVCEYVDLNSLNKTFYLFDTYCGIPVEQMSEAERALRLGTKDVEYFECYELAVANFASFPGARLIRGKVPSTLSAVHIDKVAYLSLDMNIAYPERAAIEHFWPKIVPGGVVVLDDYAFRGYEDQKASMDDFARQVGVDILTLPTGQGLIIKP